MIGVETFSLVFWSLALVFRSLALVFRSLALVFRSLFPGCQVTFYVVYMYIQ